MKTYPKLFALSTMLALSACGKTQDSSTPPSTQKPRPAGACDISYEELEEEKLERVGIKVFDNGISKNHKKLHLNELVSLPDYMLEIFTGGEVEVHLTSGSIVEFERWAYLKGETVPGTNSLYDYVYGLATPGAIYLGSASIVSSNAMHEAAHAIDFELNFNRDSSLINEIYDILKLEPHPEDPDASYRMLNIFEFFAVSFEQYYCNSKSRDLLKSWYPSLFNFFENDFENDLLLRKTDTSPDEASEASFIQASH